MEDERKKNSPDSSGFDVTAVLDPDLNPTDLDIKGEDLDSTLSGALFEGGEEDILTEHEDDFIDIDDILLTSRPADGAAVVESGEEPADADDDVDFDLVDVVAEPASPGTSDLEGDEFDLDEILAAADSEGPPEFEPVEAMDKPDEDEIETDVDFDLEEVVAPATAPVATDPATPPADLEGFDTDIDQLLSTSMPAAEEPADEEDITDIEQLLAVVPPVEPLTASERTPAPEADTDILFQIEADVPAASRHSMRPSFAEPSRVDLDDLLADADLDDLLAETPMEPPRTSEPSPPAPGDAPLAAALDPRQLESVVERAVRDTVGRVMERILPGLIEDAVARELEKIKAEMENV